MAETSARGPDGSRMRSSQLARCSRDHSSVDRWASMALRSDVVEAAGARSSERDPNPRAPLTLTLTLTWNLTPDPDYDPDP